MHDLSGTQPPWPGEAVKRWQACAAAAAQVADLWRVPYPQGDDMLRARIGERFGLDPMMITITAGVRASALSYGRLAPRILLEHPTFPGVLSVLTGLGAAVELTDWERMLHGSLPADCALWFTSPFRNPDGASLSARDATAIAERVGEGHRVIVNTAYSWFAGTQADHGDPGLPHIEGADLLGTLHKVAGHGARLGWVYSPVFFAQAVPELIGTPPSPVWQRAWGLFLGSPEFAALEGAIVAGAAAASAVFARRMHERRGIPVAAACPPHVLLRLMPGWSEERVVAQLRDRGFLVSPGSPFHAADAVRASFLAVGADGALAFADAVADCGWLACEEQSPP